MIKLELIDCPKSVVTMLVDGISYEEYFSWKDREIAYECALIAFDNDIDSSHERLTRDYLLFSGEWIRGDSIRAGYRKGLIWYYYIFELITAWFSRKKVIVFSQSKSVDMWFFNFLELKGYCVRYNWVSVFFNYSRSYIILIRQFARLCLWLKGGIFKKTINQRKTFKKILVDMPPEIKDHRYGDILGELHKENDLMYTCLASGIVYDDYDDGFKAISALSFKEKVAVFLRSVSIKKKNRGVECNNIYGFRLDSVRVISIFHSLLVYESHKAILNKYGIKVLFLVSSFNNSKKKLLILAADSCGVYSVCFPPRPITPYRPAERITQYEREKKDSNPLARFFVVQDYHSKSNAISFGYADKNVLCMNKAKRKQNDLVQVRKPGVVLVLGVKDEVNSELIKLVLTLNYLKSKVWLLTIKAHPIRPLTKVDRKYLNASGLEWEESESIAVYGTNSVVITATSTAAVEAAAFGSGVIWCPFLDEEGMMLIPIMKRIGFVADCAESLINFFDTINDSCQLERFCMNCYKKAHDNFISDNEFNMSLLKDRIKKDGAIQL